VSFGVSRSMKQNQQRIPSLSRRVSQSASQTRVFAKPRLGCGTSANNDK
jgi:hypothetical protein